MDNVFFREKVLGQMNSMFRLSLSLLNNKEDAEDAVAEVMIKLWKNRSRLSMKANLPGYIYRVTQNQCIDILRIQKRIHYIKLEENALHEQARSLFISQEEKSLKREHINAVIGRLPEKQKLILYLRMIEAYEIDEIAEIMGEKRNTIEVYLSRARKNFKKEYEKNETTGSQGIIG